MNSRVFAASNICLSEKSNDIFMFVSMRLLSTRVNRNGDAVTEEFIREIVNNQETYNGLPVYVDIDKLLSGDFKGLGHMYNRMTGKFKTTQVGALCNFEMVEDEYGVSLLAEARFPKRETLMCEKVMELYEQNALNFSFEISYMPDAVTVKDDVLYIEASERNMLTGLAIVSVPAYEEAVALSLVAEDESASVQIVAEQKGVETMPNENEVAEVASENVALEETVVEAECETVTEVAADEEKPDFLKEKEEEKEEEVEEAECKKENANADFVAPLSEVTDFALEVPPVPPTEAVVNPALVEEAEISALRAKIACYEAEIAGLKAEKAELEAYAAAYKAEVAARRCNMARGFAEKQGLDLEADEVKAAIASLDFEKLTELSMAQDVETAQEVAVAAFAPAMPMDVENETLRDRLFDNDL